MGLKRRGWPEGAVEDEWPQDLVEHPWEERHGHFEDQRPSIHSDRIISKQKVWFQERMIQKTSYSLHFSGSQHLRTTSVAAFVKDSLVNRNWL